MALHFQVLFAAAIFALASIMAVRSSVVQLGALRQADRVTGVTNLASTTMAELQATVDTLTIGEHDLGKESRNGRVYERSVIVADGPHERTFEVTLIIRETSGANEAGVREIKRKMILFR